jgi:hypothetical protein
VERQDLVARPLAANLRPKQGKRARGRRSSVEE